jgi:hypothetical protein
MYLPFQTACRAVATETITQLNNALPLVRHSPSPPWRRSRGDVPLSRCNACAGLAIPRQSFAQGRQIAYAGDYPPRGHACRRRSRSLTPNSMPSSVRPSRCLGQAAMHSWSTLPPPCRARGSRRWQCGQGDSRCAAPALRPAPAHRRAHTAAFPRVGQGAVGAPAYPRRNARSAAANSAPSSPRGNRWP